MFGISKISSKQDMEALIARLETMGDVEIPIAKYAELYKRKDE